MGPAATGVDPMAAKASNTSNTASVFFIIILLNRSLAHSLAVRPVRERAKVVEARIVEWGSV